MPNWKAFILPALKIAGVMVPQIAAVESAVTAIKSGPDKKKAVIAAVANSIELSEVLAGHEIADSALLFEGLSEINDGYVKVMQSLKPAPAGA